MRLQIAGIRASGLLYIMNTAGNTKKDTKRKHIYIELCMDAKGKVVSIWMFIDKLSAFSIQ
jgi:hypothetical protein